MIEELYDTVLSITNQSGFLDRIETKNHRSPLLWSSNFKFNSPTNFSHIKPPYDVAVFSHDNFLRVPFTSIIKEDGNIYI